MESTVSIAVHVLEACVVLGGVFWRLSLYEARLMVVERLLLILLRRSGVEDPGNEH